MITELASSILERCDTLAGLSQHPEYIDRRYLTSQHKKANQQVALWMQQTGMQTWQDGAGNQWGRYTSATPNAQSFILGSHLDTVPNSGKYDGILGVLLPVALVQYLHANHVELPFHLDIVGFGDEEGTRFGTTLLGSRAVAGTWLNKWAGLLDQQEVSLEQAMTAFGLDIHSVQHAALNPAHVKGFLEIHIEQGPVLESQSLPVGSVTGIAGAKRFAIEVTGHAGHAGTVPMELRQDALTGAAEMIIEIEKAALQHKVVATVGKLHAHSGAVNVINGKVDFSLDVRSLDNQQRDNCIAQIESKLMQICAIRGLQLSIATTHNADATPCDKQLTAKLTQAIEAAGVRPFELSSGAGHDAMALGELCPISMLFVRCHKGISHHPAESILSGDVETALKVCIAFITQLANADETQHTLQEAS